MTSPVQDGSVYIWVNLLSLLYGLAHWLLNNVWSLLYFEIELIFQGGLYHFMLHRTPRQFSFFFFLLSELHCISLLDNMSEWTDKSITPAVTKISVSYPLKLSLTTPPLFSQQQWPLAPKPLVWFPRMDNRPDVARLRLETNSLFVLQRGRKCAWYCPCC